MKKLLFSLFLILFGFHAFSQVPVVNPPSVIIGTPICWYVHYENPLTGGHPTPKSPVHSPNASIDGHTLYLYDMTENVTLQLFDEDGNEVCTLYVTGGTRPVSLPLALEGDYQIQLHNGGIYYFFGNITL